MQKFTKLLSVNSAAVVYIKRHKHGSDFFVKVTLGEDCECDECLVDVNGAIILENLKIRGGIVEQWGKQIVEHLSV